MICLHQHTILTLPVSPNCRSQLQSVKTRRLSPRHSRVSCVAAGATRLNLHIGETSITFPLSADRARELQTSVTTLLQTFADKQKAERPRRYSSMEYRFAGSQDQQELKQLEVFCNPNAASNAFTAKVLISFQTHDGVQVTTEGPLSNFKADLDICVEQL